MPCYRHLLSFVPLRGPVKEGPCFMNPAPEAFCGKVRDRTNLSCQEGLQCIASKGGAHTEQHCQQQSFMHGNHATPYEVVGTSQHTRQSHKTDTSKGIYYSPEAQRYHKSVHDQSIKVLYIICSFSEG